MDLSFIIIDDRELDCYIAEKLIEKSGQSLNNKVFYEAKDALEYIATNHPQNTTVILLDIMMPVMNGFGFIEEFEKLSSEMRSFYKIVAITTSLNKNDINRILGYDSVYDVLRKPYTYEALTETINKLKIIP